MREDVAVEKLAIGMFVAELDRPWLGTPFLIQGFVIESQEQIGDLRNCCKQVVVERSLSLGDQFIPEPVAPKPVVQRVRAEPRAHIYKDEESAAGEAGGLFGSLGKILKSAFNTEGIEAPPERVQPQIRVPRAPREPLVTIYKDENNQPKLVRRGPPPVLAKEREKGISEEEREYIEQALDPGATVRIHADKDSGGNMLGRIARLFKVSKEEIKTAEARAPVTETPVYVDQTTIEEEIGLAQEAHERVEEAVQSVIADLNKNKTIELEKVSDAVGWMVESVVRNPDGMLWLTRLKSVDEYTYDHGLNTSIYLIAFGRHLGLPEDQLQVVGTVGLMQDVGKIKLPRALIDKRDKLSLPELKVFQSHVGHSMEVLRGSKDSSDLLLEVISQHHERYDGSGYPRGLAGEQISLLGGMAGLADTYSALISARPYAQPMSVQQALHSLYTSRDHAFKADLVDQFIQCVGVFPVGGLVELNTGEVAVVVSQNRSRRLKPRVMLVLDPQRKPFPKPMMIDLIYDPTLPGSEEPYRIVRGLQAGIYDYDPKQTFDALMEAQ